MGNVLTGTPTYTEPALGEQPSANGQQLPLRPQPPTEFQRFVQAATGRMLPIYGARLFAAQQASFGPLTQAPAPENMVIGAGDELRIRIWGQIDFSANLRVSREGEIYLPKAGAVHVAGLPFSAVEGHLRAALKRVFRNFDLSVDMGEIHSIQVYVTGEARQPGEYTVSALSTLVDAIFQSGGPARTGSMRHVELKRAGKVITDFDLYALLVNGDKSGDVQLQSGDVLFIPAAGPEVALLGSVRQPAIYELRGQESLGALLKAAGGRTAIASGGNISVERVAGHAQLQSFGLKADAAGLATVLQDGDIVRVDSIVSSYRDTVTLRGSVANPGHFLWHAGMRLSDLMPDRDALLSRDYWWRRAQLGLPAPEFVPSLNAPNPSGETTRWPEQPGALNSRKPQAGFTRPSADQDAAQSLNGSSVPDSEAQPPQPPSRNDSSTASATAPDTRTSEGGNALANAGTDQRMGTETELLRPAAETDWNYAVIERLDPNTMTTSLIPFDLGKLVLQHDPSQDLALEPGDIVTVFSQDDIPQPRSEQTKYVRLEGEFVHAGIYSVRPGETLRDLVERAGGLTPKAYLYGAEFTRKSTQLLEQQRMSEYVDRLEHDLLRGAIKMATANAGTGTSQSGGAQEQSTSYEQELIAQLRQLQPTGRIVFDLKPNSAGAGALPATPLEDGDQLLVPPTPATIQVIGAVPDQNAFLYHDGARVGEYVRLAGGMEHDADRGQAFILRADGSVTSRSAGQSIFSPSGFDKLHLYPGDTVVIPEKSIAPGAMREFLSWSQLFSQLSLGAAAIDVIK